jgi:hypothetical protein
MLMNVWIMRLGSINVTIPWVFRRSSVKMRGGVIELRVPGPMVLYKNVLTVTTFVRILPKPERLAIGTKDLLSVEICVMFLFLGMWRLASRNAAIIFYLVDRHRRRQSNAVRS